MAVNTFSKPIGSNSSAFMQDIYGVTFDSTVDIYEAITKLAAAGGEDSTVTLPTGQTIDLSSLAGMTTYTTYLQLLQSHKELIDGVFVFIKNLENKLDNMLAS